MQVYGQRSWSPCICNHQTQTLQKDAAGFPLLSFIAQRLCQQFTNPLQQEAGSVSNPRELAEDDSYTVLEDTFTSCSVTCILRKFVKGLLL